MEKLLFSRICICGAGTMGRGIAQVAAQHGIETVLYDVQKSILQQAEISINQNLELQIDKGRIEREDQQAILNRLRFTSINGECVAPFIIEAIVEKAEAKINLFNQLASINSPNTILATNTSSLSISLIAEGVINPERVAGMHFFNPAPSMRLVEVIKGNRTAPETIQAIFMLTGQMKKTPVLCKDSPGFIVNRIARPYYIESLRLIEDGLSGFAEIDALLESTGFKMGPFKLMDLIGNDINSAVSHSLYEQLGKPARLQPSPVQEEMVKQGKLGKKTGQGYYQY